MVSLEAHSLEIGHSATCFRISDIPREWDNESLSRHLQKIDPELDLTTVEISGPFPDCNNPTKYQVALLNVNRPTSYLGGLKKDERRMECIRDTSVNKKYRIFIDRDFYDLTPLNTPDTIAIEYETATPTGIYFQG